MSEIIGNRVKFAIPGGYAKETPLDFTVSGIRNPRSFKPTEAIVISSVDSQGFVIDQGTDVNIVMNQMASWSALTFTPQNLTNGNVGNVDVIFESAIPLANGDTV